jgi:arylsulfatase A-like enzyme
VDAAIRFLTEAGDAPTFLLLHLFDPHREYAPPAEFRRFGADPIDLYDGEIAYTDHQLGRLLDRLRAGGRWARTVVLVTADHGEEFGEHGTFEHGASVYQPLMRVPLVLRVPGRGPGVVTGVARLIDVGPTLRELTGLPADPDAQGESLVPLLDGKEAAAGVDSNGLSGGRRAFAQTLCRASDESPTDIVGVATSG